MNKPPTHLFRGVFALLALALVVSTASAGNPNFAARSKAVPEQILNQYDLNKDGRLDEAEMAAWRADRKAAIEKKQAEARKAAAARAPAPAPTPAPVATPTPPVGSESK
jgi:hypothetical protein